MADPKSKIYTSTDMDEHGRPVLVITPSCQQYLLQKPDVVTKFVDAPGESIYIYELFM